MKILKRIRIILLVALCVVTGWLVWNAINAPPDPGYGRFPAIMSNGFKAFVIWIPYNIICMFVDGNKKLGATTLIIASLALANVGMLIIADRSGFNVFGFQFLALLSLPVVLFAIWVLSVINFINKKKQNLPGDSLDRSN